MVMSKADLVLRCNTPRDCGATAGVDFRDDFAADRLDLDEALDLAETFFWAERAEVLADVFFCAVLLVDVADFFAALEGWTDFFAGTEAV